MGRRTVRIQTSAGDRYLAHGYENESVDSRQSTQCELQPPPPQLLPPLDPWTLFPFIHSNVSAVGGRPRGVALGPDSPAQRVLYYIVSLRGATMRRNLNGVAWRRVVGGLSINYVPYFKPL